MSMRGSPFRSSGAGRSVLEFVVIFREMKRMLSQIRGVMTKLRTMELFMTQIASLQDTLRGISGLGMLGTGGILGMVGPAIGMFMLGFMVIQWWQERQIRERMQYEARLEYDRLEAERREQLRIVWKGIVPD